MTDEFKGANVPSNEELQNLDWPPTKRRWAEMLGTNGNRQGEWS